MLCTGSSSKANTYIDTIFQSALTKSIVTLSALKKILKLDIGYFTDISCLFYSATFLLASNCKNESILFLAELDGVNSSILSQAQAYYLTNKMYALADDLIVSDRRKNKPSALQIFDNIFNFINNKISINESCNILNFFIETKHLTDLERNILIAKLIIYHFLHRGETGMQYLCNLVPLNLQNKELFQALASASQAAEPRAFENFISALSATNFRTSFTNNIETWMWEFLLDNSKMFAEISRFLSNNLNERIRQYHYAFQKYHETSNFNEFQYTLSFIYSHEGDNADLIRNIIFSPDLESSLFTSKSLEELPLRFNTFER